MLGRACVANSQTGEENPSPPGIVSTLANEQVNIRKPSLNMKRKSVPSQLLAISKKGTGSREKGASKCWGEGHPQLRPSWWLPQPCRAPFACNHKQSRPAICKCLRAELVMRSGSPHKVTNEVVYKTSFDLTTFHIYKTKIPTASLPNKLHIWFLKVPKPLPAREQSQAMGILQHKAHFISKDSSESKWKLTACRSLIQWGIQGKQNLCTSRRIQVHYSHDRKWGIRQTLFCFLLWVSCKIFYYQFSTPFYSSSGYAEPGAGCICVVSWKNSRTCQAFNNKIPALWHNLVIPILETNLIFLLNP